MININVIILLLLIFGCTACDSNVEKENSKIEIAESISNSPKKIKEIWRDLSLKFIPLTDTTSFDNIKELNFFSTEEIELLQLNEIFENIEKEGYGFKITPSYKLELSNNFYTIILNVFKGDSELETVLINYDLNEKLVAYVVIAYDEIAEGWSRKYSTIKKDLIIVIDEFYGDNKQVDTIKFHITNNGEINQVERHFNSDLKPNNPILLSQEYTDTIEFSAYNDDGDYFILLGKKNGNDVSLIYNWEWYHNQKYNFEQGDMIKVKWKMDRIFIAGDGETLEFKEIAIDAERVGAKTVQK